MRLRTVVEVAWLVVVVAFCVVCMVIRSGA